MPRFVSILLWFTLMIRTLSKEGNRNANDYLSPYPKRFWRGPVCSVFHPSRSDENMSEGENLPLVILGHLSNWFSVLEDRGTVAGELGCTIHHPY